MIQIYPGTGNKGWVVNYEFHNLPSDWGYGRERFDTWEEVMAFVTKIHNKERRLRFMNRVYDSFDRLFRRV
jgi:hypothetical protein